MWVAVSEKEKNARGKKCKNRPGLVSKEFAHCCLKNIM